MLSRRRNRLVVICAAFPWRLCIPIGATQGAALTKQRSDKFVRNEFGQLRWPVGCKAGALHGYCGEPSGRCNSARANNLSADVAKIVAARRIFARRKKACSGRPLAKQRLLHRLLDNHVIRFFGVLLHTVEVQVTVSIGRCCINLLSIFQILSYRW